MVGTYGEASGREARRAGRPRAATALLFATVAAGSLTIAAPSQAEDQLPASDVVVAQAQEPAAAPSDSSAPSTSAALRPSSDAAVPEAGPDERGAAAAEAALALRLPAEELAAVPMEKLDDALMTTGSIAAAPVPASEPLPVAAEATPPAEPEPAPPPVVAAYAPAEPAPVVAPPPAMAPATDPAAVAPPPQVPSTAETAPAAVPPADAADSGAGHAGRINSSVKMRAKPDNAGGVVSVLAANESITVLGCDVWCEVEAAGKRGYVFRKFVETP